MTDSQPYLVVALVVIFAALAVARLIDWAYGVLERRVEDIFK